ncbi:C5a anaphylatoxin chemotactic receptor 1-like [Acanthaster planci]|uniref:C5a anaphylatoxin chemotactic receptor 1-like n=1 Tax=Acanthaster planci TaxID=133434 RepID=A0A8B7ZL35_ACAPL|nr:C5a anaphylatoxin chemotactic receptor 1-like [Acanthaster planci]
MAMLPTDFFTNGSESPDGMGDDSPECILWGEIFRIVLCSLVMVFGLPGNSLILGVYWDKLRKTSTHILIMGLAWADLFTCLFLTHEVVSSCLIATSTEWGTALLILKSLMMVTVSLSIGITAVIALDRYDCVCCSNRRRVTPHLAKVAILCSLIFSALIQIIYVLHVVIDPLRIQMKLTTLAAQFIMFVVSVMLILVCYLKVFSAVRRHVKVGVHTWPHHAQSSDHTRSNPVPNISEWQETVTATLNSIRKLTPPTKLKAIALNPALQQGATSVESTTFLAPKIATRPTNLKAPTRLQHTETSKDTERNIQTGHSDTAPNRQRMFFW